MHWRKLTVVMAGVALLGASSGAAAKQFATKAASCETIALTAVGRGDAAPLVTVEAAREGARIRLFVDRSTGTLKAAKVFRPAEGGRTDIVSIPVPVVVTYSGCHPGDEKRAISIEYFDAADFLP